MTMKYKPAAGALALALALAGCGAGGSGEMVPASAYGPITTYPIVTTQRVPQGMTPTGSTGYALANSARSNASIVDGTAEQCGPANAGGGYEIACGEAAGLPGAAYPYRR